MKRNYESYLGEIPSGHPELNAAYPVKALEIRLGAAQFAEIDTMLDDTLTTLADEAVSPIEVRAYSGDDWVVWRLAGAEEYFTGDKTAHLAENQQLIATYSSLSPFQQMIVIDFAQNFVLHKLGFIEPGSEA